MSLPTIRVTGSLSKLTGSANVTLGNGSAAAPAFTFASSQNSGMFVSGNTVGISSNGMQIASFGTGNLAVSGNLVISNGTSTTPSLSFTGASGTGLYNAANVLGLSANGASMMLLSDTLGARFPVAANTGISIGSGTDYNFGMRVLRGAGDGASFTVCNGLLSSWNGIGMHCSTDNTIKTVFDTRNGHILTSGRIGIGTTVQGIQSSSNFFHALDSSMANGTWRYLVFGKMNSTNNQAVLTYSHISDGSTSNQMNLGLTGINVMTLVANGQVFRGDNGLSFNQTSDERIKTDIEDANTAICYETLQSLGLKRFRYNPDVVPTLAATQDTHRLGLLAQDVQKILPKSTMTMEDRESGIQDLLSINPDQILWTMFGALQELQKRLTTRDAKLEALEARLAALES